MTGEDLPNVSFKRAMLAGVMAGGAACGGALAILFAFDATVGLRGVRCLGPLESVAAHLLIPVFFGYLSGRSLWWSRREAGLEHRWWPWLLCSIGGGVVFLVLGLCGRIIAEDLDWLGGISESDKGLVWIAAFPLGSTGVMAGCGAWVGFLNRGNVLRFAATGVAVGLLPSPFFFPYTEGLFFDWVGYALWTLPWVLGFVALGMHLAVWGLQSHYGAWAEPRFRFRYSLRMLLCITFTVGLLSGWPLSVHYRASRLREVFAAVAAEDRDLLAKYLRRDPDLANAVHRRGDTVLHAAIQEWCDQELLAIILSHGADTEGTDQFGATALHSACLQGEHVEFLLDQGADINAKNHRGRTPIHALMRSKSDIVPILELMIARGADVTSCRSDGGATLLHDAMSRHSCLGSSREEVLEILLEAGVDPHERVGRRNADAETRGTTALHFAVASGSLKCVERLVELGADVKAQGHHYHTPLHRASTKEIAEFLISHGADPNARTLQGDTPLHSAARADSPGVVKALVNGGAEVDSKGQYERTPLLEAVWWDAAKAARALMAAGADPDAKGEWGDTAREAARGGEDVKMWKAFIDHRKPEKP